MKIKNSKFIRNMTMATLGGFILLSPLVMESTEAFALESGSREKVVSKNGQVHKDMADKILKNIKDYSTSPDFIVTRYTPRDSTEVKWLSQNLTEPKIKGNDIYATHFYKKGGKDMLFTLSVERAVKSEKAFKKSGAKAEQGKATIGGSKNIATYNVTFDKKLSDKEKKSILPLQCEAHIQYAGSPIAGAFGDVDWGSIAGDVSRGNYFKRHTEVLVEKYGYGKISDQGGAIKQNRLDLFYDDCDVAMQGGRDNKSAVIFKTKEGAGVPNKRATTKEDVDKIMKTKKWGENNSSGKDSGSSGGSSDKEKTESKSDSESTYKSWSPFIKEKVASGGLVGVDAKTNVLPSEMTYTVNVFAKGVMKASQYLMVLLVLILIIMYGLQIFMIALMLRGDNNKVIDKLNDIAYGKNNQVGYQNFKSELVKNGAILIVMIGFTMLSLYTFTQQQLYAGISTIIDYIF